MIRRLLTAALDAGTLSRTVLVLSRQLDNAHLLAASEEARADRAELRVAELEAQQRDWAELSGELAAEQPAADALPDLTDAGEAPIELVLADSAREVGIQRDRADALAASLRAAELDLIKLREAKLAADIRADVQRERAEQAERDRDTNARAAGAHIATINDLRKRLDDALRAVHKPAPAEQIQGVAAADDPPTRTEAYKRLRASGATEWQSTLMLDDASRYLDGTHGAVTETAADILRSYVRGLDRAVVSAAADGASLDRLVEIRREAMGLTPDRKTDAGTDDPPPTRPSSATRTT